MGNEEAVRHVRMRQKSPTKLLKLPDTLLYIEL